jgi:hypothetical protein
MFTPRRYDKGRLGCMRVLSLPKRSQLDRRVHGDGLFACILGNTSRTRLFFVCSAFASSTFISFEKHSASCCQLGCA